MLGKVLRFIAGAVLGVGVTCVITAAKKEDERTGCK